MAIGIEDETLATAFDPEVLRYGKLNAIFHGALAALPMRSLLDPQDARILDDLSRIACTGAGIFAVEAHPAGREVTIAVPNKTCRRVVSEGPRPADAHTLTWRQAFFAALAAREREATEVLTHVSLESLRKGQVRSPAWFYAGVEAMQALVRKRDDAGERLTTAMKAADPETCDRADRSWVLDIARPVLELAWNAYSRDQQAFDEAMWKALEGHKHYYSKAEGKRDIMGMIALRPLAMAVWAKDLGITTTVESDYIPRWIIDR